ncbi:MAG: hypothetical protein DIU64_007700 [Caldicoprobacter oshimai]|uniref:N-acetyltransferase domain-containing protein n=1 Tax=Caldicoprobacter faecalis TaxID=937334 RepID=A0A1I5U9Q5_9FIRM|nr:GNAT family N-acetyltransferase [Caldicoprobacter faecalis]PZN10388.1 MAG: hypothetical protein DIU64_06050 [Caldicoprobacter oshimai]SFP92013.1 hypothetical protein SAMN05444406_106100 [Caldicoprobacter faecalis]
MITFRKIEPQDLDKIYLNEVLRPLITVSSQGERFAVVIEEDGAIKGGVSGYRQGEDAFMQQVAVLPGLEEDSLLDGLIRSLVYILERDGVQRLFAMGDENWHLYERIGFKRFDSPDSDYCLVLDIPSFFEQKTCR